MLRVKLILAAIIILCSYLYFSKPRDVVINVNGKVEGIINKTRALIQKERFWKFQLESANNKYQINLSLRESLSSQMREIDSTLMDIERNVGNQLKDYYSPEQGVANALRREADRIEKEENYRMYDELIEKQRLRTIEECRIVIPIIEARISTSNPSYAPKFLLTCILSFVLLVLITKLKKDKNTSRINESFEDFA